MKNEKKYNVYTFLSFFAKSMIEIFISIILYKKGITLNNIFLFMLFNNILSVLFIYLITLLKNKISFNILIYISFVSFILFSIYLFNIKDTIFSLFLLSLLSTIHNSIFWILRHIYIINIYKINNMSNGVGNILVYTEIAYMLSSLISAYVLDNLNYIVLIIISSVILFISNLIFSNMKISIKIKKFNIKIYKSIPKQNIVFFTLEQFKIIGLMLFPLYLTLVLKTNYKFMGIFNILIGVASIISILLFSRFIGKKKKSYLFIICIFYSLIWILKINLKIKLIIFVIAFLEGIISKIYQVSITRFTYALGKSYDEYSYVIFLEIYFNIIRFIISFIIILFFNNLKIVLYICGFSLILIGCVKFNDLHD